MSEENYEILDVPYGNPDKKPPHGPPTGTALYLALAGYVHSVSREEQQPTIKQEFCDERYGMDVIEIDLGDGSRLVYTQQYNRQANKVRESVHAVGPEDNSDSRFIIERAENPPLQVRLELEADEESIHDETFFYRTFEPGRISLSDVSRYFGWINDIRRNAENRYSQHKKQDSAEEDPDDFHIEVVDPETIAHIHDRITDYPLTEDEALEQLADNAASYTALSDPIHQVKTPKPVVMPKRFEWVSLANIPMHTPTKKGVRYSQFETENMMMTALAVCYNHILPIHYDHLVATLPKQNKVFYFGSKKRIDHYTILSRKKLTDGDRAQLIHRMSKAFSRMGTEHAEAVMKSRGRLYLQMAKFCLHNREHIYVGEPEDNNSEFMHQLIKPLKGIVALYSLPPRSAIVDNRVEIDPDSILEGLIDQLMDNRGCLQTDQVIDTDHTVLRLGDKSIIFVGDSTQAQAEMHLRNAVKLEKWRQTDIHQPSERTGAKLGHHLEAKSNLDEIIMSYLSEAPE